MVRSVSLVISFQVCMSCLIKSCQLYEAASGIRYSCGTPVLDGIPTIFVTLARLITCRQFLGVI